MKSTTLLFLAAGLFAAACGGDDLPAAPPPGPGWSYGQVASPDRWRQGCAYPDPRCRSVDGSVDGGAADR